MLEELNKPLGTAHSVLFLPHISLQTGPSQFPGPKTASKCRPLPLLAAFWLPVSSFPFALLSSVPPLRLYTLLREIVLKVKCGPIVSNPLNFVYKFLCNTSFPLAIPAPFPCSLFQAFSSLSTLFRTSLSSNNAGFLYPNKLLACDVSTWRLLPPGHLPRSQKSEFIEHLHLPLPVGLITLYYHSFFAFSKRSIVCKPLEDRVFCLSHSPLYSQGLTLSLAQSKPLNICLLNEWIQTDKQTDRSTHIRWFFEQSPHLWRAYSLLYFLYIGRFYGIIKRTQFLIRSGFLSQLSISQPCELGWFIQTSWDLTHESV